MKPADADRTRRSFLVTAPVYAAALAAGGTLPLRADEKKNKGEEEDVSTNEDLMREHGVLKRVLLVYDEIVRRIRANQDFPPQAVTDSANIIRQNSGESQPTGRRSARLRAHVLSA